VGGSAVGGGGATPPSPHQQSPSPKSTPHNPSIMRVVVQQSLSFPSYRAVGQVLAVVVGAPKPRPAFSVRLAATAPPSTGALPPPPGAFFLTLVAIIIIIIIRLVQIKV
jgi:hypothetical protein